MIFSEIIEQILFERGIDHKELATELGISSTQVKNLHSGTTKMPSERTISKIIRYCEQHDIDIDVDWNDVLYDIFSESESFRGYTWVKDLDEDGCVVLRHQKCGRKTCVPRQAFINKSTPCIHCWVERYVSPNAYDVDLSESDDKHMFTHKCGHSYYVTYNEIKQKKFYCPECNDYRCNTDNMRYGNATYDDLCDCDDLEIDEFDFFDAPTPEIAPIKSLVLRNPSIWDAGLKASLDRIASERGFSIESYDSIYCRLHYPEMTDNQFAFICNTCFVAEIFDKNSSIEAILDFANRHQTDCEKIDICLVENTKQQNIVWIPDVERVLDMASLFAIYNNPLSDLIDRIQNVECTKTVFTAGVYLPEDDKTTYLFYHYVNNKDKTDYVDFFVSIAPTRFNEMAVHSFPKTYTDELYNQIQLSMNQRIENIDALQKTCDEYVDIVNFFKGYNPQIFIYAALGKFLNNFQKTLEKSTLMRRQEEAEKLLSMQHCPVCHNLHRSTASVCTDCGFDELNKSFINKDEYELWLNKVVIPARKRYENNE